MNVLCSGASRATWRVAALLSLLAPTLALGAGERRSLSEISVGHTVHVSADDPGTPLGEVWLAANPRDPKNMVSVSMAFPKKGPWASVMYYTQDAGSTWHRVTHGPSHDEYFWGADPHVQFGPDGVAYYTDLEWGAVGNAPFGSSLVSASVPETVYVFRSTDGGRSWSEPIALDGVDHSCIAIDRSHGKYRGRVYVAYTSALLKAQGGRTEAVGFAYSDDDGRTYRQKIFAPPTVPFRDRIRTGPSPTDIVVTPDGTVTLAYIYYLLPSDPAAGASIEAQTWVMSSSDGGRTFHEPHLVASDSFPADERSTSKIGYWPRMAVDESNGPTRGRLYVTDERPVGKAIGIFVFSSSDAGQTWNPPVRVDDGGRETFANTPGIAVSADGVLGVSWYDRRNDPKNDCFQEYFSASVDGGLTFLPNRVVHAAATCTNQRGNWQPNATQSVDDDGNVFSVTLATPGLRFANAGETHGIAAVGSGGFELAWINGESGVMQLAATRVDVAAKPLGEDTGDLMQLDTTEPALDADGKSISMQVVLTNRSLHPMHAPLTLLLTQMDASLQELRASNTNNGITGVGAAWKLEARGGGNELAPGASTAPLVLRFSYSKAEQKGSAPSFEFHVFERRQ
ncbi:MAG TPA: sialidase family protein [Steroidobacteraceae bacterium]|nr:sialidase family protein [Steroidobacteraceae bacterium]